MRVYEIRRSGRGSELYGERVYENRVQSERELEKEVIYCAGVYENRKSWRMSYMER